jgi:DNA-binding response OmpR family regulator
LQILLYGFKLLDNMQSNHTVIVIEDDESIREMYKYKLSNHGYTVHCAKNGIEGLIKSEETMPDLILLDLMMPEMSGDEMLAKLRETDWGARIRVVILTNLSKNEAPHSLRFLNVDRYIVKAHSTPTEVTDIVNEILGKKTPGVV